MKKIPLSYLPKSLSKKDREKQKLMIMKSRKSYKENIYRARKSVASYRTKKSSHIKNASKLYNIDKIIPSKLLSTHTGCSVCSLKKIVKKGEGAFYSSGSRPNQTAKSWGLARLASSITGGKASAYDYDILKHGCKSNSKALMLAKGTRKKNGWKDKV